MKDKYDRGGNKSQKSLGILGLDPLVDHEGRAGLHSGLDLNGKANAGGYGIRGLVLGDNWEYDCKKNREDFDKKMHAVSLVIKKTDKDLNRRRVESSQGGGGPRRTDSKDGRRGMP